MRIKKPYFTIEQAREVIKAWRLSNGSENSIAIRMYDASREVLRLNAESEKYRFKTVKVDGNPLVSGRYLVRVEGRSYTSIWDYDVDLGWRIITEKVLRWMEVPGEEGAENESC